MDLDEREMMREDDLKDQLHEKNMRCDFEYFCDWTIENLHFDKSIFLFDVIYRLRKHCKHYEQDSERLFESMGGAL